MVKSKLSTGNIIILSIIAPFVSAVMLFAFLIFIRLDASPPAIFVIFLLLLSFWIYVLFRDCKSITVDKKRGYLKWTSLFRPQGGIIELSDLMAYARTEERSKVKTRSVIHLIDKERRIVLKIHGLFCKNIDELVEILNLPEETNFTEDFFGSVRLD